MKLSELIEKYGDCEVKEELLEMVKPKGDWKPKLKESYYFITGVGSFGRNTNRGDDHDNFRIARRNCYRTAEEAQFALDMYNFCKERSFEPDWNDFNQPKVVLYLGYDDRTVDWRMYNYLRHFIPFYYPSTKVAQEIIDKYSFEELEKYYGRV